MDMVLFQIGGTFETILQNMQNMGFFLYLFPFLLALAILYGVMEKVLGESLPKSARGLISIILSFFVMLFASWNPSIVVFFASLSGMGLLVMSGLLFIVILFGLIGFDYKKLFDETKDSRWIWIFGIIFIGLIIFFGAGAGNFISMPAWSMNSEFLTALFFIAIVAVVIVWFGRGEGGGGEKK